MIVLVAVEAVALALLALLVAGLLRSHAEILRALHRLGEGADEVAQGGVSSALPFPLRRGVTPPRTGSGVYDVVGTSPSDETLSVAVSGVRIDTLLAFLSGACTTCSRFWEDFGAGADLGLPDRTRLVIVTLGPGEESPARLRRVSPRGVPVVMSSEAWQDYGVPGAPYFILIDGAAGTVRGEGSASSWPEVRSLLLDATGDGRADGAGGSSRSAKRASTASCRPPGSTPAIPASTTNPKRAPGAESMVVVAGIAVAVLAALRASWSP